MTMIHTYQSAYEVLADATVDQAALDGATAGQTIHWHDLPAENASGGRHSIQPAWSMVEIIAESQHDATNDSNAAFKLWGYADGGPVGEYIADISCTVGTSRIEDSASALYIDTMVIAEEKHVNSLTVSDSGNNRVAKLTFDAAGFKWIVCKWYDVSGVYRTRIRGW